MDDITITKKILISIVGLGIISFVIYVVEEIEYKITFICFFGICYFYV